LLTGDTDPDVHWGPNLMHWVLSVVRAMLALCHKQILLAAASSLHRATRFRQLTCQLGLPVAMVPSSHWTRLMLQIMLLHALIELHFSAAILVVLCYSL
jgi:hypothetical protein